MRRFTLPPERVVDGRVTFDAEESRHLTRVLRLRPGDTVMATDGAGRDYTVRLESIGEAATGIVLTAERGVAESPLAITLVQGYLAVRGLESQSVNQGIQAVVAPGTLFVVAGTIKCAYDLVLWRVFRRVELPP